MRQRIYEVTEISQGDDVLSRIYDWFMMITIIISIIPLFFIKQYEIFIVIDRVTVVIFIADYILRLFTADLKLNKGKRSFLLYPWTPMALIDLISILPSLSLLNQGLKLLKIFRLFRTLKVLKVFRVFRYSKNIQVISNVLKKQANALLMVCMLALGYIVITALIVLNVEPQTFDSYFKALYWATISLTTMGYGDIYPVSRAGQILTMISSLFGIAIVALPAGIITAGYMEEIQKKE